VKRRAFLAWAGALLLALSSSGALAAEADECTIPPDLTEIQAKLPHLSERLHGKQPVTIVAIGGASTKGSAAGGRELAYPHRMQVALTAMFPDVPFNVVNKGVSRDTTQQMLDRFATDVFAEDPVLVIWEAGISDAVRGIEVDDFAAALQKGINEVKNRAIDILLVDMQFSHSTTAVIDFQRYLQAIHRVGDVNDIYVFPRFDMMRYWSEQHMFNFDETTDEERARVAAKVYDCLGRRLAREIQTVAQ